MRRLLFGLVCVLVALGGSLFIPSIRQQVRAIIRPESPPPITPIVVVGLGTGSSSTARPTAMPLPASPTMIVASRLPLATATVIAPTPKPSATPEPTATPGPVEVNGRIYDAYIAAASKEQQAYQYSCEFDAAWVILQTFGRDVSVDEMVKIIGVDQRIEPYIEERPEGFIIHGGNIGTSYSGNYKKNFLARSTGAAMRKVFEQQGLRATPVHNRAGIESALRSGALVWMKTTVDFKKWRPAIWRTPEGQSYRTVLGNDHAVVVIGFNSTSVVIRDVLGPTSSNWQRPYEYEVDWATFLKCWEAQAFDGLAVSGS